MALTAKQEKERHEKKALTSAKTIVSDASLSDDIIKTDELVDLLTEKGISNDESCRAENTIDICSDKTEGNQQENHFSLHIKKQTIPLKALENANEQKNIGENEKITRARARGTRPDYSKFYDLSSDSEGMFDSQYEDIAVENEMIKVHFSNNEVQEHSDKKSFNNGIEGRFINTKSKDKDPDFCLDSDEDLETQCSGTNTEDRDEYSASDEDSAGTYRDRKHNSRKVSKMHCNLYKRVRLDDHRNKYRIESMVSIARKDRGKSKSERSYKMLSCLICNLYKTSCQQEMEHHLFLHISNKLTCKICGYVSATSGKIIQHRMKDHPTEEDVTCEICGATFATKGGLKGHLGSIHGSKLFCCTYCKDRPNAFTRRKQFMKHMRSEHKESMFKCEECFSLFVHKGDLKNHLRNCKGNKRVQGKFICEHCGCAFASETFLSIHINRTHKKIRKCLCPHCPFAAWSSSNLNQHLLTHTGEHQYSCDQCSFSCIQHNQLKSHMRTHAREKPFKCDLCNYAAAWNVQLKDHNKVHGMACTVMCQECRVVFKNSKCLKLHIMKEHMGNDISCNGNEDNDVLKSEKKKRPQKRKHSEEAGNGKQYGVMSVEKKGPKGK